MLERDHRQCNEGSGTMLFQLLKSILMILPQSACYRILRDRLVSVSKFRQSTMLKVKGENGLKNLSDDTRKFVARTYYVRNLHCLATWRTVRQDSLEVTKRDREVIHDEGADRRSWLGYESKEEQFDAERVHRDGKKRAVHIEDISPGYHDMGSSNHQITVHDFVVPTENEGQHQTEGDDLDTNQWKKFWASADDQ
jgi:hypothetical protein